MPFGWSNQKLISYFGSNSCRISFHKPWVCLEVGGVALLRCALLLSESGHLEFLKLNLLFRGLARNVYFLSKLKGNRRSAERKREHVAQIDLCDLGVDTHQPLIFSLMALITLQIGINFGCYIWDGFDCCSWNPIRRAPCILQSAQQGRPAGKVRRRHGHGHDH